MTMLVKISTEFYNSRYLQLTICSYNMYKNKKLQVATNSTERPSFIYSCHKSH